MNNRQPNDTKQDIKAIPDQESNLEPMAPAKSAKFNRVLIIILILLILPLYGIFAYFFLFDSLRLKMSTDSSTPTSEIEYTESEEQSEIGALSTAQVESLLRDKYKFNTIETVFIDGWPKYIENLDQANKILFTIYQLTDGNKFDSGRYTEDEAAIVRNISFDDFNDVYIYYFGNAEPLEKKDYHLDSIISKIVYRPENNSFNVYFPDGIGGYSTTRLLSKLDSIFATTNGFKAVVLTVTLNSEVQQDTEESLSKSSQGNGKWFYNITMDDDVLEEIRNSLSAYEFNFINDDGEYKLVSIDKI